MKNRKNSFLFSGILLAYFALKGEFLVWYNGIALVMSITALVFAFLEYKKEKSR